LVYKAHRAAHIEIRVGGCHAVNGPKDKPDVELFFSGTLKIKFEAMLEGEGGIVIRRRPITLSKTFILKPAEKALRGAQGLSFIEVIVSFRWIGSDTTGRFGKTGHLAGSLARAGGKQLVNVLQFETGNLGKNPNHRGNSILLVIFTQDLDDFLMLLVEFVDALFLLDPLYPFLAPVFVGIDEPVFVDGE
jgi:hypothetical protein